MVHALMRVVRSAHVHLRRDIFLINGLEGKKVQRAPGIDKGADPFPAGRWLRKRSRICAVQRIGPLAVRFGRAKRRLRRVEVAVV